LKTLQVTGKKKNEYRWIGVETSIKRREKHKREGRNKFPTRWCQLLVGVVFPFLSLSLPFLPPVIYFKEEDSFVWCRRQLGLHPRARPLQTAALTQRESSRKKKSKE